MKPSFLVALTALTFAPCLAHAGSDQTANGAIGADGAVIGPIGGVQQLDRSVAGAIGSDGAVIGPIGGVQANDRSAGGAIGVGGSVLGPLGQPSNRALSGGLGTNGAVIAPTGGRLEGNSLGGAIGANGAIAGPVGGFVGANGQDQRRPVLSIGGPVVPGQYVPQSQGPLGAGSGGLSRAIVNGHDVLIFPGTGQIFQVLN